MKTDFRHLTTEIGKFAAHTLDARKELNALSGKLSRLNVNLNMKSIRRIWDKNYTLEKPSEKTLNRLALLAGFQNWADLRKALHGDNDADLNYND